MPAALPHFPRFIAPLLLGVTVLFAGGCYHHEGTRSVYSSGSAYDSRPADRPATALVIVIQGECTEAQYLAWRRQIVSYLVERGYIAGEDELIGDPAQAQRIIRAIVSEGGFTLSVFNDDIATHRSDLEFTDIYYPADPYFIFGFLYFGEIGPRHLPPRSPDYRPHPRPPSTPPPYYPPYDRDRHRPHPPRPDDRDHDRPHNPPAHPGNWNKPPRNPSPTEPAQPPADRPHHPRGTTPPNPPPDGTTHRTPYHRPDQPRDPSPSPEPTHNRPGPGHFTPPPSSPPPSTAPAKPEKAERKDEDKKPHRQEPER